MVWVNKLILNMDYLLMYNVYTLLCINISHYFLFYWFCFVFFRFFFCHEMYIFVRKKNFSQSFRTLTSELTLVPFIIRVIFRVRQFWYMYVYICSVYVRGAVLSSGPVRHLWQQDRIRLLFLLHYLLQWTGADLAVHTPNATYRASGSDATPRRQLIREKNLSVLKCVRH
mgnify:CR=1 FL=1